MHFLTDNQPVRQLARRVGGMAISTHAGDSEAVVALPRPTPLSIVREIGAAQAGLSDYLLKAGLRSIATRLSAPRLQLQP